MQTIILPQSIVANSKATSKKRLFADLARLGADLFDVDADLLQTGLQEREDLGPTGMGAGIAIPHARIDGIDSIQGIFVRLETPMEFESSDHQAVDLVFALFAPKTAGAEHLKALARVSRVLRDADIRDRLRSTNDTEAIYAILIDTVDSVAA